MKWKLSLRTCCCILICFKALKVYCVKQLLYVPFALVSLDSLDAIIITVVSLLMSLWLCNIMKGFLSAKLPQRLFDIHCFVCWFSLSRFKTKSLRLYVVFRTRSASIVEPHFQVTLEIVYKHNYSRKCLNVLALRGFECQFFFCFF